ncbi:MULTISPECIES: hypothetical protein [Halobacteriovorax]|uniref:Uncharacterized protein n=1 Tax=Halobacteriovorax vibrionivorans TaxID=2152716 RepID=A0ABY0IBZ0_9BACT|nr:MULTISPECIES: hypothetical protein [Halobacteriovorax]AYF44420.1 hypothetical protein BALOs_1419 [Halobacteriovorax sp. BALOs_7]RZF20485.1 hypothetical protein DAY19_10885 [Halobacteriovorax vibrionivorans]TGD48822.1 hypothetical protein EP118_02170 [Halobacteriovorax sp. Y22]
MERKTIKYTRHFLLTAALFVGSSSYASNFDSYKAAFSKLNSYKKVCNYSSLSKKEKNEVMATAFSMMTDHDKKQLSSGVSNYIVFLKDTRKHFAEKCGPGQRSNQECQSLSRRAKTFYKYDVQLGLDKVDSYVSQFHSQIKLGLSHCKDSDKVIADVMDDIHNRVDINDSLNNSEFDTAIAKMAQVAKDFSIELKDERVPFPIKKKDTDKAESIYDSASVDNTVCYDKVKKATFVDNIESFAGEVLNKFLGIFNPKKVKSVSLK